MAAPSNSYRTKTLKATKGGVTSDCLIAIPDVTAATLKTRFYLDVLLAVDEYDASGNKIAGFIGGCKVGTANHAMHNTNRHFTLDGTEGSTQIDFFNDAGLNTLPITSSDFSSLHAYTNLIVFSQALFKSAHWVNTNSYGFEFKLPASSTWIRHAQPNSALPQQQEVSGRAVIRMLSALEKFTQYQVRAYIENAEGTYYTPTHSVITGDYLDGFLLLKRSAACTTTGQTTIFAHMEAAKLALIDTLTTNSQNLGLFAYKDDVDFTELDTGWYSQGQTDSYYYAQGSGFTHKQVCTVQPEIELRITVKIKDDGSYEVDAVTEIAGSQVVNYTGTVSALNGQGSVMATFPINVSIAANQLTGTTSGYHGLYNIGQYANWSVSGTPDGRGISPNNVIAAAMYYADM